MGGRVMNQTSTVSSNPPILWRVAILGCFLALSSVALGDTLTRKHDKPLAGEVTDVSKTEVTIKVKSPREETIKVPANAVISITWTGEPADLSQARSEENGGKYQRAIDAYQKAQAAYTGNNLLLKTEIEYGIARSVAWLALANQEKFDEAAKRLEDFRSKNGDHYRFYETQNLLGQLYAANQDSLKAEAAFATLGKAPWKDLQMQARIALGRIRLAENKLDEAAAAFASVLETKPENPLEVMQRQEAQLGQVRVLSAQKKFDEALPILDEVITRADAENAKLHAEAYLRQGECLSEKGLDKDAILAYLHVNLLFASEKSAHAEALYHLVRLWTKVGDKARADDARDELFSEHPSSPWTRQLQGKKDE
jgi:tetratricopeptide (TPR) repeat protein